MITKHYQSLIAINLTSVLVNVAKERYKPFCKIQSNKKVITNKTTKI